MSLRFLSHRNDISGSSGKILRVSGSGVKMPKLSLMIRLARMLNGMCVSTSGTLSFVARSFSTELGPRKTTCTGLFISVALALCL